ncbi:hypothetical protein [Agromyces bauzanensis]|uniref:hypothetical protein n=1 Tax=Agromyces bauzanensis TaxID=1308924 RepID=UPI00166757D4|nr:hypothetical protein [Agromyces bauzanensis]
MAAVGEPVEHAQVAVVRAGERLGVAGLVALDEDRAGTDVGGIGPAWSASPS